MPPWQADGHAGEFVQHPTPEGVELIGRWAPVIRLKDLGRPRRCRAGRMGWHLGTPDLVVTLPAGYTLPGEQSDVFRIFAVPLPVGRTRYVRGIKLHPGNARVVHHANIRVDATDGSRRLDADDPAPGYDGLLARSAEYPDGHFLGWTPGQIALRVHGDLAWRLDPGTDLVVQLHLQPSGKPKTSSRRSVFSSATRRPTACRRSCGWDRRASTSLQATPLWVKDRLRAAHRRELLAVQPHAHYRAANVEAPRPCPTERPAR